MYYIFDLLRMKIYIKRKKNFPFYFLYEKIIYFPVFPALRIIFSPKYIIPFPL